MNGLRSMNSRQKVLGWVMKISFPQMVRLSSAYGMMDLKKNGRNKL